VDNNNDNYKKVARDIPLSSYLQMQAAEQYSILPNYQQFANLLKLGSPLL